MLIPIGHDQQTVRRLPWVTFAIIAINVLVFVGLGTSGDEIQQRAVAAAQRAFNYWLERPYLQLPDDFVRAIAPSRGARERLQLVIEARRGQVRPPEDREQQASEQRELNALIEAFRVSGADHPYARLGLVPSRPTLAAFLTSMFMHAGWLHLLGNMFMLYLAGPAVEDAFGRPLFAGLYLVSGLAAAASHLVVFPHSDSPLVGASGAIAGVMGAFLVRCFRSKIRFFYWWMLIRAGTFDAPAWLMLPLWLGQQFVMASLVRSEGGVAYWAHVGGFVFGAGAAFAIKAFDIEKRYIHPKIEKEIGVEQHPALEEGLSLLARGECEAARRALRRVLAAEPSNPDARLGMWQSFVAEDRAAEGAEHLIRVIDDEVKRKELALARDHWKELVGAAGVGGPAPLRWRLGSELEKVDPAAAVDVFRHLGQDDAAGLLAEKARHRLERAVDPGRAPHAVPPPPVPAASRAAGARPAAPPEGRDAAAVVAQRQAPPAPPSLGPFSDDGDGGWQPAATAEDLPAPESRLSVEDCVIERLALEGPVLRGPDGAAELLQSGQVEAVAVGGIAGEGGKPYLVVDLVIPEMAGGWRACRLRSSQFDPRALIGRPQAPALEAFRELVERLLGGSRGTLLPDGNALARLRTYPSLAAYEEAVLSRFR